MVMNYFDYVSPPEGSKRHSRNIVNWFGCLVTRLIHLTKVSTILSPNRHGCYMITRLVIPGGIPWAMITAPKFTSQNWSFSTESSRPVFTRLAASDWLSTGFDAAACSYFCCLLE